MGSRGRARNLEWEVGGGTRAEKLIELSRKWHSYLIFAFRFHFGEIFPLFILLQNIQNHHLYLWSWFHALLCFTLGTGRLMLVPSAGQGFLST